jgi:radical SAM superfamily enzyme YgiQ (UPF0313 family)
MRILLVSTYELGHQPLHVASPAAALRAEGHDVRCLDLAVQPWDPALLAWAERIGFSVPMHTAMRLAVRAAEHVAAQRPELPLCFYGLYAPVSTDTTVGRLGAHVIAGEYEPALLAWARGGGGSDAVIQLGRGRADFRLPARDLLPPLQRYARLDDGAAQRLVGYVEATHGCAYRCRHCPLPTVYDGAFRVVGADVVIEDIAQLVALGAEHITFGDPDFLNGPTHARRVVAAMHERFPHLTFDCTTKVEHILDHADLWPELAARGCTFVVTAVESLDDETLRILDKGHTAAQAYQAVGVLRRHGIEPRPTFLPFTPWTAPAHLVALLDYVVGADLVDNVDPVQYTIRLLVPEGSLLLERPELTPHLQGYDTNRLSYRWRAADPRMDELQRALADLVEAEAGRDRPAGAVFMDVAAAISAVTGDRPPQVEVGATEGRPRLTEPWFC